MPQILKDITLGEFIVSQESPLYNTDVLAVTAPSGGSATAITILPGQPVTAAGASPTSPVGIAVEAVTLQPGEMYNLGILKKGYGVVLNKSKLVERYPALYTSGAVTALEALGYVFKN